MLTTKDIIKEGHPTLRTVASDVALPPSYEDAAILAKMMEYLQNSQNPEISMQYNLRPGVGLAAPQINVLKKMIAVHISDETGKLHSYALFNPRIISHSVERSYLTSGEGCLSVERDVPGLVPRYARVTVKATTLQGEEIKLRLKGLIAIVFQHEIDHLHGVMFYDHINQQNPFQPPEGALPIER
ncbi:peptide deformylase [Bacillus sp. LL01]|uniref:peptide deformylase n=1 Tax=Bacillus sp. LL01 TaxID=1665556 RepID=UPI00064D57A3|nr:peptide deformylase [Bacillus sp. LL01]KMJ58467.1 peptide deformylase [Bacillus sp. LL01]